MNKLLIILLLCGVVFNTQTFSQRTKKRLVSNTTSTKRVVRENVNQKISRYARTYGIPEKLFRSLIYAESANKPRAYSYKGAACYTQLMPATARRFGLRVNSKVDERWNVDMCLDAGAKYLRWLLVKFNGDIRLALAGYNAGEGAVMKYGNRVPPYKETVKYVEKILYFYTGQKGHGISAAYNQRTASLWVNGMYGGRSLSQDLRVQSIVSQKPLYDPNNYQAESNEVNNSDETVVDAEDKDEPKNGGVTRIELNKTPVRIRTKNLVFKGNCN